MLKIQNLTVIHREDRRTLFADLSFSLSYSDRMAVIGEEGNGKSTLLRLIADPDPADAFCEWSGSIRTDGERIGCLAQRPFDRTEETVCALCARHPGMASADWGELASVAADLGLPPDLPWSGQPVSSLSGGERVKLALLLLRLRNPTLYLLDEPGNDLDIPALEALERFILTCGRPVLFVTHDECLLEAAATRILHLEQLHGKAEPRHTLFSGGYAAYRAQRENAFEKQEARAQSDLREKRERDRRLLRIEQAVAHAQDTISRADPHGGRLLKKKMKAVKSLERRFEREDAAMTSRPWREYAIDASFDGDITLPAGKTVLRLEGEALRAGGRTLCGRVDLLVRGPEKVLIVGANGSGKTTLLRHVHALLEDRRDLNVGWMPQSYDEALPGEKTPAAFLDDGSGKERETKARMYLGAFRFTREEMLRPLDGLSGGQKAKLLLLRMILDRCDVLLLDEPTRNLSPLSAPEVRRIITEFTGAVIAVTHDRTLMRMWPGRILRLDGDGLSPC